VVLMALLLALANAQYQFNRTAQTEATKVAQSIDSMLAPLDPLPPSNISQLEHVKTPLEEIAEDPDSLFLGRDADSLTYPTIVSRVPESNKGRGNIQGRDEMCSYLLSASLGVDETADVHGQQLYTIAARLECEWASCRMCQQRLHHLFDYCTRFGAYDFTMRGACEDKNPDVQNERLKKLIFRNPDSCRVFLAQEVLGIQCSPDDATFCQGAYTVSEVCKALGNNKQQFLQSLKFESLSAWFCKKTRYCTSTVLLQPAEGVQIVTPSFGDEPGAEGLDILFRGEQLKEERVGH